MNIPVQIGETFGIEYETDKVTGGEIPDRLRSIFRTTRDASVETDAYILNNGLIIKRSSQANPALRFISKSNITLGTEFVSVVLNGDETALEYFQRLTDFLSSKGEENCSERSGIHFHISMPNPNLSILKTIFRLGMSLEALFFRIGGMGYCFRGEVNDATYCRPITKIGPPIVNYSYGGNVKSVEQALLLKSRSFEDFWYQYGDLINHPHRYTPIRYLWLSLYSMFTGGDYKGTLEFRLFNKTLNPFYMYAGLQLCKAFTNYCILNFRGNKFSDFLGENSVFDSYSDTKIHALLGETVNLLEIDNEIGYILESIINATPPVKIKEAPVLSHLYYSRRDTGKFFGSPSEIEDKRELIKNPSKPKYTDIHVLRGE